MASHHSNRKIKIFYSYAHQDEKLRDELEKHLAILGRQGVIESWHDRKITPGMEWKGSIDTHLKSADIILLLISADFIASDYCYDIELMQAMKRHEEGEAYVIPIILRPVNWTGAPFSKLEALPKDAKPVTNWENYDDAFLDISQRIRAAVESKLQRDQEFAAFADPPTKGAPSLGPLVFKLCNRSSQVEAFSDFFVHNLKHRHGTPHFYFVHGERRECHDSLIERLMHTKIKRIVEKKWGEQGGVVVFKKAHWPHEGEFSGLQQELRRSLFSEFDPVYMDDDLSARALSKMTSALLSPLIIIRHNIYAEHWTKLTKALITWYIDYWAELKNHSSGPQFLIFFNIIYPSPRASSWWRSWLGLRSFDRGLIKKELEEISLSRNADCPCLLLKELTPPKQYDVGDWFSRHNIYNVKVQSEILNKMFGADASRMSMADIEHELQKIHRLFVKENGYL